MSIDATAYTITIQKINIEGDYLFKSTVKELPDVADYAETYSEAYELAIDAIETTAEMLEEDGRSIPKPQVSQDDYSGRVTLRLPKTLHMQSAQLAETEGVSLNTFVVAALSEKVGLESFSSLFVKKFENHLWEAAAISSSWSLDGEITNLGNEMPTVVSLSSETESR